MRSRTTRLAKNHMVNQINDDVKDFTALKTTDQIIDGDSLLMYGNQTSATYDINQTVQGNADAHWRIIFTPNVMQNAYSDLIYNIDITNGTGYETVYETLDPDYTTASQVAWQLGVETSANNIGVLVKFGVKSVDQGSIVVSYLGVY